MPTHYSFQPVGEVDVLYGEAGPADALAPRRPGCSFDARFSGVRTPEGDYVDLAME